MTWIEIISLIVGFISIVLAIVAMFSAKYSADRSQQNFEKTQDALQKNYEATQRMMQENYDKTKDVLAEIDKKAAIIDNVVHKNQEQMLLTITNLINETMIPKKVDIGEQFGMQFLQTMLQNPSKAKDSMEALRGIAEMAHVLKGTHSDK